jgi:hypothetical protein
MLSFPRLEHVHVPFGFHAYVVMSNTATTPQNPHSLHGAHEPSSFNLEKTFKSNPEGLRLLRAQPLESLVEMEVILQNPCLYINWGLHSLTFPCESAMHAVRDGVSATYRASAYTSPHVKGYAASTTCSLEFIGLPKDLDKFGSVPFADTVFHFPLS